VSLSATATLEPLGEDDPEDSECLVEARLRSLADANAVLADGHLALQRKDSGGQYRLGQQQQKEEAAEVAQHLPSP